jgi:hypothetical protein
MNTQRITSKTRSEPIHFWYEPLTADAATYTIDKPPTEKELETICTQIRHLVKYDRNDSLHFVVVFPKYKTALFFMPKRGLFYDFSSDGLPEPYKRAKEQIAKAAQGVINSYKQLTANNQ